MLMHTNYTNKNPKMLLLVGAGYMAKEYAKVLKAMQVPFIAVGRSKNSAEKFEKEIGVRAMPGGIINWLKTNGPLAKAIVAVTENQLGIVTRQLINAGYKEILVEKPGGLDNKDIKLVAKSAKNKKTKVFVAYNRRFYASVQKALEIIKKEGISSFNFDFTERSYIVEKLPQSDRIKKEWFLQNSTHVIDMAFFLGGWPKKLYSLKAGKLKWHPSGSKYVGAGTTDRNAIFSYHANWESAGRWSLEVITSKSKLIFRPLEKLQIQRYGEMAVQDVQIDDQLDIKFKPGLYNQVKSFFEDKKKLSTIEEQVKHLKYFTKINK